MIPSLFWCGEICGYNLLASICTESRRPGEHVVFAWCCAFVQPSAGCFERTAKPLFIGSIPIAASKEVFYFSRLRVWNQKVAPGTFILLPAVIINFFSDENSSHICHTVTRPNFTSWMDLLFLPASGDQDTIAFWIYVRSTQNTRSLPRTRAKSTRLVSQASYFGPTL